MCWRGSYTRTKNNKPPTLLRHTIMGSEENSLANVIAGGNELVYDLPNDKSISKGEHPWHILK